MLEFPLLHTLLPFWKAASHSSQFSSGQISLPLPALYEPILKGTHFLHDLVLCLRTVYIPLL